jgi:hypothetical protein
MSTTYTLACSGAHAQLRLEAFEQVLAPMFEEPVEYEGPEGRIVRLDLSGR